MVIGALLLILLLVLVLPFLVRWLEENLEIFFFVMGLAAVSVSGALNKEIILIALKDPIKITLAVFLAGALSNLLRDYYSRFMQKVYKKLPLPIVVFFIVVVLGLLSSVITAIIAALILVEIIVLMPLERKHKIVIVVLACFSIGLGAALTPIGEPLATIAVSKLDADFFYLFRLLGRFILPSLVIFGLISAAYTSWAVKAQREESGLKEQFEVQPENDEGLVTETAADTDDVFETRLPEGEVTEHSAVPAPEIGQASPTINLAQPEEEIIERDNWKSIIIRAAKIYLFVMALTLLGEGFKPLIDTYVLNLNYKILYWINIVSAVLDNATLTAAEISPRMDVMQIEAIIMGLLYAGGMLIPGNIPNIISASKLRISSTEWAKIGVPFGLVAMIAFFMVMCF